FFWMRYVASLIDLSIGQVLRPLKGVTAATVVMAGGGILAREALLRLGLGAAAVLGVATALGVIFFAFALRRLAPREYDRVHSVAVSRIARRRRSSGVTPGGSTP